MSATGTASAPLFCDQCGLAPCETVGLCERFRAADHELRRVRDSKHEPPRPLMRELPPADPFPVEALGSVLAPAASAINDRVRAPLAICVQSVLAVATLAVQGHANVELPMGQPKPLSNFFVSIAATGERKSAVDQEALWPVRKREAALREAFASERLQYENAETAWNKAREAACKAKGVKDNPARMKAALDELGPAPLSPLEPLLTCGEPTYEGVCKLLAAGQPSIGIFADRLVACFTRRGRDRDRNPFTDRANDRTFGRGMWREAIQRSKYPSMSRPCRLWPLRKLRYWSLNQGEERRVSRISQNCRISPP